MSVTEPCSYHPTKAARFHCPKCEANFCPECISRRQTEVYGKPRDFFFCPKCNVHAEVLSVGSFIAPFWNRLPKFFAYPFHLRPLLLILLLSSVGAFLSSIPFVSLILWVVLIKYCYAIVRNTVSGNLRPPELSYEVLGQDIGLAFKQIALFIIMSGALALIFVYLGAGIGLLSLFFGILLIPAMIIVLVISDSLINALNPVTFVTIAYRIGWGYLLMYLFLALLYGAPALLARHFYSFMSPVLRQFLFLAASQYYTIISYSLMGYVILQYHEQIGYEVSAEDFLDQTPVLQGESASSAETKSDATAAILNQVTILMKEGRAEDALFVMQDYMRRGTVNRTLAERYYNLLKITQREAEMLAHGRSYLDLLTVENDKAAACEIYRECLSRDPQFNPNPDALFRIAGWCLEDGDAKNGWNAFVRFIKANPQHGLVPKAYFLLGKNANEKLHDAARAEKALKSLIKLFPDHDLAVHARSYLEKMSRISST
jgi:tetratricopeptide (TPR) repeat protein